MSRNWIAPLCAALSLAAAGCAIARPARAPAPAAPPPPPPAPAASPIAVDPAAADRELIRARLGDLVGGMVARDPAAMDRVLAGDFQTITYGGRLVDRAGDISAVTASPDFEVKAVTTKEVDIRVYGDAAVVRALIAVIERRGDKLTTVPIRITQTWIRQAGEWRAVADQATRVEHPELWTPPAPVAGASAAAPATVGAAAPNG